MTLKVISFSVENVETAKESLLESIGRLPVSVQGWPKHVLKYGTDKEIVDLANKLCRTDEKQ